MKILYVGNFSPFHRTENYVAHALRQYGDVRLSALDVKKNFILRLAIEAVQKEKPDVVLFSKAKARWIGHLIEHCRANKILTVAWLWDLYFGFRRERPPQFRCDVVCSTDGGHEEKWRELGVNHHILRQGIHDPDYYMVEPRYECDVGFVGNRDYCPARRRFVRWLKKQYGGRFVLHTNTRGQALNEALSRVKVIVGDSYPASNYWSNRIYEITGRGGFLLHPETVGLEAEFTDGLHYVAFDRKNFPALREKIDYYVGHDAEREKIRIAGWARCGKYTYHDRVEKLLEIIEAEL